MNVEAKVYETEDAEQWLVEIMDTYGDRLTKLAYSYVRDWGVAQEVVQDVFLICYKSAKRMKSLVISKLGSTRLRSTGARTCFVQPGSSVLSSIIHFSSF